MQMDKAGCVMFFCFPAGMFLPVGVPERQAGIHHDKLPSVQAAWHKRTQQQVWRMVIDPSIQEAQCLLKERADQRLMIDSDLCCFWF